MTNAPFASIEDFRDIESRNHYAERVAAGDPPEDVLAALRPMSRDNARTPMQWDASPNAGFTSGTPWIGVNPNHAEINAEAERANPESVFHHYRRLIELRHTLPVIADGDFTMLLEDEERGWNSLYWNNHDQPRVVSRFGDDSPEHRVRSAKMLGTILHLHRGTPYVYQGEELGMTNAPFNVIHDFRDIESLNHYAEAVEGGASPDDVLRALRTMGRDNARTPMQWDAGPHAGFTQGEPWLGVNPNHTEINAEDERANPDSVFHHYRRLIELRHDEPAVALGDFTMLLEDDPQVYAFTRALDGTELLVVVNVSGEPASAAGIPDAEAWAGAELVLTNAEPEPQGLELGPWEARVYRR